MDCNTDRADSNGLCAPCQNITLNDLVNTKQKTWFSPGEKLLCVKYNDLNSSQQNCPLCKLFSRAFGVHMMQAPSSPATVELARQAPGYPPTKAGFIFPGGRIDHLSFSSSASAETSSTYEKLDRIEVVRMNGKRQHKTTIYGDQNYWIRVALAAEDGTSKNLEVEPDILFAPCHVSWLDPEDRLKTFVCFRTLVIPVPNSI